MSIESKIEALTAAVTQLTEVLRHAPTGSQQVAPTPAQAVPSVPSAPVPPPVAPATAPVAAMPAPPFAAPTAPATAPVAVATVGSAPFADAKGLINYIMSSYRDLGPEKGAQIQGVLTGLGYSNVNDVKPDHYGQLFAGVEALKS